MHMKTRNKLTFQGTDFKRGDMLVFNEKNIGHALEFEFADDMQAWAVKLDEEYISCHMGYIRKATKIEHSAFLRFSRDFKTVQCRMTCLL